MTELICPTGCENELPELLVSECNPTVDFGEIGYIYITNINYPLTDFSDLSEWNTRLSNDSTDVDAIRYLYVAGDKPPAEANESTISLCRKVYSEKNHTVNFDLDESNVTNYDAMRQFQCGGTYLVWYATPNYLYGGNGGIEAEINIDHNLTRGCTELNVFPGTLKWQDKDYPESIANPLT